jgi:hypothetical protein
VQCILHGATFLASVASDKYLMIWRDMRVRARVLVLPYMPSLAGAGSEAFAGVTDENHCLIITPSVICPWDS